MQPSEGEGGLGYLDAFVGRRAEIDRLRGLVERGERLVTVLGPGGIGKTRLVEELARELRRARGQHAVVFCDLTGARDGDAVVKLLALSLDRHGDHSSLESLGAALASRDRAVLVIDNCEQVIDAVAPVVKRLLDLAPRAQVIATSRQVLHLRGESVVELPPLGVPEHVEDIDRSEASSLLLDRTRRARADFELRGADREALFAIVRALEGVPLAIELAAPRIARLGPATVLARLGKKLELLTGGSRDRPGHHRALRDTLDWSWELLSDAEKSFLSQLSVFRGGFTLAAAEAVVDRSSRAPTAVDLLQALREKSLVQARSVGSADGEPRFGLLETLRELAEEKLDPELAVEVELRHARHYASELQAIGAELDAKIAPSALVTLDLEKENLRVLVDRMLAPGPLASERGLLALRALGSIEPAFLPFTWARLSTHLDAALAIAPDAPSGEIAAIRARALVSSANVRWRIGPLSRARADFELAAATAAASGERLLEGRAIAGAAMVGAQHATDLESLRGLESALAIHREVGDRRFEAATLLRIGLQLEELGDAAGAMNRFEGARVVARASGDVLREAQVLAAIGVLLAEGGDFAGALERLEEARAASPDPVPTIECSLAMAHHAAGDLAAASSSFERGIAAALHRGDRYSDALCRGFLALVAFELGDEARARTGLESVVARFDELDYGRYSAFFLAHLATLEAAPGAVEAPRGRIALARKRLDRANDPLHLALDLQEACVDAVGAGATARARWMLARDRLAPRDGAHRIVEVHLSLRVADVKIRAAGGPALPAGIRVERSGAWFERAGDRVELGDRAVLRRLLARLAKGRAASPGEPIGAAALIEAAWPSEKMHHSAAKNRLKVHVAKLRDLGLRGVLLSSEGGYFLDPTVAFDLG